MQNTVNDEYGDDDDDDDDDEWDDDDDDNKLSHNAILSDLHKLTARYIF